MYDEGLSDHFTEMLIQKCWYFPVTHHKCTKKQRIIKINFYNDLECVSKCITLKGVIERLFKSFKLHIITLQKKYHSYFFF